ncbi:MAG: glycosyltransferase [Devosia nanyangense]|uniref:Glycosyltransferase n=1 Tax=Devosia nanyangense TaxID=1228055 RepID=A0A933L0R7_9HYPH|nr:glycosyltransferase [Devosia nanyangense]
MDAQLSIVIGFRDWGLDRLKTSLGSHRRKCPDAEIVLVDFGSQDGAPVEALARSLSVKYLRREGPVWSRSRALNDGIDAASNPIVVITDADIIFTADVYEQCIRQIEADANAFAVVQCWDLPPELHVDDTVAASDQTLAQHATIRPRWGVGGCSAFRKSAWQHMGGLDNRMLAWGGEDTDFFNRLRRSGLRPAWLEGERTRIYHIYHPPTRTIAGGADYLVINRNIVKNDASVYRNLVPLEGYVPSARTSDAVDVVIVTKNRAAYLEACLRSVAAQTVAPASVIVVDDGSEDNTAEIAGRGHGFDLHYIKLPGVGTWRSRNIGTSLATAKFVCVMDDGDLMLPGRIADHLSVIESDTDISYGGWINFDQAARSLDLVPGKSVDGNPLRSGGQVIAHGATMFSTQLLRDFPYTTALRGDADLDLMGRMVLAGAKARHTGTFVLLRRLHQGAMATDDPNRERAARTRSALHNLHLPERRIAELTAGARAAKRALPASPDMRLIRDIIGFAPPEAIEVTVPRRIDALLPLLASAEWMDRFPIIEQAGKPSDPVRFVSQATETAESLKPAEDLARAHGMAHRVVVQGTPVQPRGDRPIRWSVRPGHSRLLFRGIESGKIGEVRAKLAARSKWRLYPVVLPTAPGGTELALVTGLIRDARVPGALRKARAWVKTPVERLAGTR